MNLDFFFFFLVKYIEEKYNVQFFNNNKINSLTYNFYNFVNVVNFCTGLEVF